MSWQCGGGTGREQNGNGAGINSKLLDVVEGRCLNISVQFCLQETFSVGFSLLGLVSQFPSHVMHGLHEGGGMAIQSEHIVFKDFDILVRRLAESKGNSKTKYRTVTHATIDHQKQCTGNLKMQCIGHASMDLTCTHCYSQRLPGIAAIPLQYLK